MQNSYGYIEGVEWFWKECHIDNPPAEPIQYKKIDLLLVLSRGEMAYFGKNYPDSIEFFNRG